MRGTLHLVPAEDAAWMEQLLAPRMLRGESSSLRWLELDRNIIERSKIVFYEALHGGQQLPGPTWRCG